MLLKVIPTLCALAFTTSLCWGGELDYIHLDGRQGAGTGKHIVFIAGDEEYRSEESMPMMAQVINQHGFKCTVIFSTDPDGTVNPGNTKSLTNSKVLDSADAIVMCIRFRDWHDEDMTRFDNALLRGTPIIALRTSTHGFKFSKNSPWAKYSFNAPASTGWHKGFGREVLGESWVSHHGKHKFEGTRSMVEKANAQNPILHGVETIFGTTDVYGANPPKDSTILLRGEVTQTLQPDSPAVQGKKNNPMVPIAWTRNYKNESGKTNKVFTTTMGASTDLTDEHLRRLITNAVYWAVDLEIPAQVDVTIPGVYEPTPYSINTFKKGLKPADFMVKPNHPEAAKKKISTLTVSSNDSIAFIGGGLGSRMNHFGYFETEIFARYPDSDLTIRNLCKEGDTPGFRPHAGRKTPWAFPNAKDFHPQYDVNTRSEGTFEYPDEWLTRLKADTIIAFFGFSASYYGKGDLDRYKLELDAFIKHTLNQKYNGTHKPQLAIVSPAASQDLSEKYGTPSNEKPNVNIKLYTSAMKQIAEENNVTYIDLFTPSETLFTPSGAEFTTDGIILNDAGYQWLAKELTHSLFGQTEQTNQFKKQELRQRINEKNWCWLNDYKIANGVHVYGARFKPHGKDNYPYEIEKTRQMTANRDQSIWHYLRDEPYDLVKADSRSLKLPDVPTNYRKEKPTYKEPSESKTKFTLAEGYQIDLFASEKDFKDLVNPAQISFDNRGRLWVATMPSYPHYKIGDAKPTDKLIILEDTDNDGKADKQTTFAGDLHMPTGFEIAPEGVYVAQGGSLVLLSDTDGDDQYDKKEILHSGYDCHDTHHAISAFSADPSGAIVMGEGIFLHSNIETAYGTVRGTNGGFFRYNPRRKKLTRHGQMNILNPWGTIYDDYGQSFFLNTSNSKVMWMNPALISPQYGRSMSMPDIITSHHVRPTSGFEVVSSSHFPDDVQGDVLINNTIGYLGAKQHQLLESGTGFTTKYRHDLFKSSDKNFRPSDLEFAPDGSLYIADWHNALIGHMQHNARDPNRDNTHGRIYRVTYPSRPLVETADIHNASIPTLLENLTLPEARTRYRTRRELRGRDASEVMPLLSKWASQQKNERHQLEALWVSWGLNTIDQILLHKLLASSDHKIRAAAVQALRFNRHQIKDHVSLLTKAASDSHGRVRLEAITAASRLYKKEGLSVLEEANKSPLDQYLKPSYSAALDKLNHTKKMTPQNKVILTKLKGKSLKLFEKGSEIYHREAHCATCHLETGKGLPDAGFPPLAQSKWALGNEERLIKLTLNGLYGPITVKGKDYHGHVPMTAFGGMLNDTEIAAVLTYTRNAMGNEASVIYPKKVKEVREATKDKTGFYKPEELLKDHPH